MSATEQWQLEEAEVERTMEELGELCRRAKELRMCPYCLVRQLMTTALEILNMTHGGTWPLPGEGSEHKEHRH